MEDGLKRSEPQMAALAINSFNVRKNEFLRSFNDHPMTQEIVAGPGAKTSLFRWGSLFSFIGFQKGDDPIHRLDMFFKKTFIPPPKPIGKGDSKKVKIIGHDKALYTTFGSRPDLKDIEGETHWPWNNMGSWALDIEKGKFLHYAYYIFGHFENDARSWSGRGLQSKKGEVRPDNAQTPRGGYLRTMLDKFDSRF